MAYEVVMPYHLHMPSYFLETFTEYPHVVIKTMRLSHTLILKQSHLILILNTLFLSDINIYRST